MTLDLVLLAADKTIETGTAAVFARPQAIGCAPFSFKPFVHIERDPGCYRRAPEFLSTLSDQFHHAIVIFDREGSGATAERAAIEQSVEERLEQCGWKDRSACIVNDPEIETWFWSSSPHVETAVGWSGDLVLREWMAKTGLWPADRMKPPRPKEALQAVLRTTRKPLSSALYGEIASKVSLTRCADPAFLKLRNVLTSWFPLVKSI